MKRTILLALLLAHSLGAHAESVALSREGGTFLVPVLINDKIKLDFTIDSGATDVTIPADVFSTMVRSGTVDNSDIIDTQVYRLADGSEQSYQRFRLRSLRVGNLELRNVISSIVPEAGNLLLGQSFLSQLESWSVDNQRQVFVFNESPSREVSAATTARRDYSAPANSLRRWTGQDLLRELQGPQELNVTSASQERLDAIKGNLLAMALIGKVTFAWEGKSHCKPANATVGQAAAITQNYLNENPEIWHYSATVLVGAALGSAWPCPEKKESR